jgi:hypothetical protein
MMKFAMNYGMKMNLVSEFSDGSDEEDNVNEGSGMQHKTWTKVGAEQPHFPFSGKPELNVHLEDPNNLLDNFEILITLELAELISRETNRCVQQFL